jgi:hypothetical protein
MLLLAHLMYVSRPSRAQAGHSRSRDRCEPDLAGVYLRHPDVNYFAHTPSEACLVWGGGEGGRGELTFVIVIPSERGSRSRCREVSGGGGRGAVQ